MKKTGYEGAALAIAWLEPGYSHSLACPSCSGRAKLTARRGGENSEAKIIQEGIWPKKEKVSAQDRTRQNTRLKFPILFGGVTACFSPDGNALPEAMQEDTRPSVPAPKTVPFSVSSHKKRYRMKKLPTTRFFRKPDGRIMLRYRYRTNRVQISTQLVIDAKFWDDKAQRPVRGVRQPELLRAGQVLNELSALCDEIFVENGYGNITPADFKEELQQRALSAGLIHPTGWATPKQEAPEVTFMQWVDMYTDAQRPKVKPQTMKKYGTFKGFLKDFTAHRGREITFDEIGKPLRDEMARFLRHYKGGTQVSHCNKLLQQLKQFAAEAYPLHHNNNTFIAQKWAIPDRMPKQRPVYLTPLEVQAIAGLELTGKEEQARDLFLIGLYTGQRVSDYWRYEPAHFRNDCLDIHQVKGKGERVVVPLDIFPQVRPILERYGWASPRLADSLDSTSVLLNRMIKDITRRAGIDEPVTRYKQIADLPPVKETAPKWQHIASHTARRTFATTLYNRGYTLAEIMPMTGHEKESTLMKYIGTTKDENAKRVKAKALRENGGSPIRKAE